MILILYTRMQEKLNDTSYLQYMNLLPLAIQNSIRRFHFWQDTQRSLFGKLLLLEGLKQIGLADHSLEKLLYSAYHRPYFNDIDFNISHSGEFVICAISKINTVGIDVEEMAEIEVDGFDELFSGDEITAIINDKSLHCFYTLWTQKEAFLKAIGKGLYVPLNQVHVKENSIWWEGKKWYLHKIELGHLYLSHLCTNNISPEIILKQIQF